MKITKRHLKRIIREEKTRILKEMRPGVGDDELIDGAHDGALMDLDDHNRLEMEIDSTINGFVQMGYSREDVVYALKVLLES